MSSHQGSLEPTEAFARLLQNEDLRPTTTYPQTLPQKQYIDIQESFGTKIDEKLSPASAPNEGC